MIEDLRRTSTARKVFSRRSIALILGFLHKVIGFLRFGIDNCAQARPGGRSLIWLYIVLSVPEESYDCQSRIIPIVAFTPDLQDFTPAASRLYISFLFQTPPTWTPIVHLRPTTCFGTLLYNGTTHTHGARPDRAHAILPYQHRDHDSHDAITLPLSGFLAARSKAASADPFCSPHLERKWRCTERPTCDDVSMQNGEKAGLGSVGLGAWAAGCREPTRCFLSISRVPAQSAESIFVGLAQEDLVMTLECVQLMFV